MNEDIKLVGGMWLPAHDAHLGPWMVGRNEVVDGKLTYQYHKLRGAMRWVRAFRGAVDIGAHCGLWSVHLAKLFRNVYSFEPIALHRKCFELNVVADNVMLIGCALGEKDGSVAIHTTQGSSGDSWVDGDGDIPMKRLDDTQPAHDGYIDFVKLDCEGYELFALRGGEELLKANHPCVVVEQKPGRAQKWGLGQTDAVAYLQGLGAKLRQEISGDYILSWD